MTSEPELASAPEETPAKVPAKVATVVTLSLGNAIALSDPALVSSNISVIRRGMNLSLGTANLVTAVSFLAVAAALLGAGVLGDNYGRRRMFLGGAVGVAVFGFIGAAAPSASVLIAARVGSGVSFAFLLCLPLAIVNASFPPGRTSGAIALYLGVTAALAVVPPIVGSELVQALGWRSGLLVTPVLALVLIPLTVRYVPETPRIHRNPDWPGLLLAAVALGTLLFGFTHLSAGLRPTALVPIVVGLLGAAAFLWWETRAAQPALDLRVLRSPGCAAALIVVATYALISGGSAVVITGYLVIIRAEPTTVVNLLYIPAAFLSALTAIAAGRIAARVGAVKVMTGGLVLVAVTVLARFAVGEQTPLLVVGAMMAAVAVAGSVLKTAQTTVLMASAPAALGGVVSAVQATVQSASYAVGSVLCSQLSVALFGALGGAKLEGRGVSADQARDALRTRELYGAAHGIPYAGLNKTPVPDWLISATSSTWIEVGRLINMLMAAACVGTAVMAWLILRRAKSDDGTCGAE